MKIICKILLCLLIFGFGEKCDMVANAKVEKTTYAKALTGCVLYKTTSFDNDVDNIFFIVPETYFVVVLDEISNICLKVQYDKFVGYVDSRKVVIATFSPIVKTLDDVTCDVKETSGTQIWNKPSTEGDVLTTISANTKSITYIESVYGTIQSGGECNLW